MPDPRQAVIKAALNGDIVGFSRLMADDFVSTTVLVTTLREGRAEVAAGGGTLVNFVGDSFMAVFDDTQAAVQAISIRSRVEAMKGEVAPGCCLASGRGSTSVRARRGSRGGRRPS